MNLTEFISKFAGFADRTDKRLEEALTGLRADVATEREKVSKLEASVQSLSTENAKLQTENVRLAELCAKSEASALKLVEDAKAEVNAEAGKQAANIIAAAGFTQAVPAENQSIATTKAEHWKRFNSLPETERYPYWKKNRDAMAD
jgi:regulator of replication initiation timing